MNKTIIFSDNSLWGFLNFRMSIMELFLEDGYTVVVVAPNDSFVESKIPKRVIFEPVEMQRTGSNPIKDLSYMKRLKSIYKKYSPSIVFHYTIKPNIYGTMAAKSLNIPTVAMVTGLGYSFWNNGVKNKIARSLYRFALRKSDYVLFLNEGNYKAMLKFRAINPNISQVLKGGEGVDTTCFTPTLLADDKKIVFLMIARVLYDKGYNEYVAAARANPNAIFQLIGAVDSNPMAVPESIIKNEGSIEYLGFMPKDDVKKHIEKCHCVVLPSYHEGMSITLTEAIAMGRPVICSDIPGCRETVDDGINGYLVPPKDAAALSFACNKFIELTNLQRQSMANKSREKAINNFDVLSVQEVYKDIVQKMVK